MIHLTSVVLGCAGSFLLFKPGTNDIVQNHDEVMFGLLLILTGVALW